MNKNINRNDVANIVKSKIADVLIGMSRPIQDINEDDDLSRDFGMDSLNRLDLIIKLERAFEIKIPDAHAENLLTVGEYVDYVYGIKQNTRTMAQGPKQQQIQKKPGFLNLFKLRFKTTKDLTIQDIEKSDKSHNELVVLQDLLFASVDIDKLQMFIKQGFGCDIPKEKLSNVCSLESLFNLINQSKNR